MSLIFDYKDTKKIENKNFSLNILNILTQNIQEDGDDACIDQISEHSADDRNNEERFDRITIFIAYSTHVGHSIGGCTKAETTHSCTQNGSIVIAT